MIHDFINKIFTFHVDHQHNEMKFSHKILYNKWTYIMYYALCNVDLLYTSNDKDDSKPVIIYYDD